MLLYKWHGAFLHVILTDLGWPCFPCVKLVSDSAIPLLNPRFLPLIVASTHGVTVSVTVKIDLSFLGLANAAVTTAMLGATMGTTMVSAALWYDVLCKHYVWLRTQRLVKAVT